MKHLNFTKILTAVLCHLEMSVPVTTNVTAGNLVLYAGKYW